MLPKAANFIGDAPLVAHNADFDPEIPRAQRPAHGPDVRRKQVDLHSATRQAGKARAAARSRFTGRTPGRQEVHEPPRPRRLPNHTGRLAGHQPTTHRELKRIAPADKRRYPASGVTYDADLHDQVFRLQRIPRRSTRCPDRQRRWPSRKRDIEERHDAPRRAGQHSHRQNHKGAEVRHHNPHQKRLRERVLHRTLTEQPPGATTAWPPNDGPKICPNRSHIRSCIAAGQHQPPRCMTGAPRFAARTKRPAPNRHPETKITDRASDESGRESATSTPSRRPAQLEVLQR